MLGNPKKSNSGFFTQATMYRCFYRLAMQHRRKMYCVVLFLWFFISFELLLRSFFHFERQTGPLDQMELQHILNFPAVFESHSRRTIMFLRSHRGLDSWKCDFSHLWGPDIDAEFIGEILYDYDHLSADIDALPTSIRVDVLAYASSVYSAKQVLGVIMALRPAVILHLSDEEGNRPEYEALFAYTRLAYRQYRYTRTSFKNPHNQRILPIGYHCWDEKAVSEKHPAERNLVWSFVGTMATAETIESFGPESKERQRYEMVTLLDKELQPNYYGPSKNQAHNHEIFANSRFVLCPHGNINVETSRLYTASKNGAIPIVI